MFEELDKKLKKLTKGAFVPGVGPGVGPEQSFQGSVGPQAPTMPMEGQSGAPMPNTPPMPKMPAQPTEQPVEESGKITLNLEDLRSLLVESQSTESESESDSKLEKQVEDLKKEVADLKTQVTDALAMVLGQTPAQPPDQLAGQAGGIGEVIQPEAPQLVPGPTQNVNQSILRAVQDSANATPGA